jgi:hypothetical protein
LKCNELLAASALRLVAAGWSQQRVGWFAATSLE